MASRAGLPRFCGDDPSVRLTSGISCAISRSLSGKEMHSSMDRFSGRSLSSFFPNRHIKGRL
jgi:hypothetical protein